MEFGTSRLLDKTWQVELICHGVRVVLELKSITPRVSFYLNEKYRLQDTDMSLLQHGSDGLRRMLEAANTDKLKEKLKGLYDFSKVFEAADEQGFTELCALVFLFLTEKSKDYLFKIPVNPYRLPDGTVKECYLDGHQRLAQLILDDTDFSQAMINRASLVEGLSKALSGSTIEQKKNWNPLKKTKDWMKSRLRGRKPLTLSPLNTAGV